ncbi:protein rep [Shewanella fidelis]|uniref:Protein rep n=1 Tax=Shewanella fidelis TaxID=173509 RepID=A0AAW8NTD0_9GAMM|nr:protein rep [Shewanella fidelis]MDR8526222.1 protein rep [Shewanella fidelis]MDW4814170.1 protein rep [Shewanella fidelis]MDW4818313.1 protein rep [Shewanella fidelis]MDW4822431.1 protein rep [Shewanella fidelis]MDW4826596.1 protein rep [Shewanella fidelis]
MVSKQRSEADFERSEKSALGINAKSITPPLADLAKRQENRAERYRIQSVARELFAREGFKQKLEREYDYHRTCKCLVVRQGEVQVRKSKEHKTAFYGGLVTCGSVWSCPVCTAKIQERRRTEISTAMDKAYQDGMKCVMVTLTFPHMAFQKLDDLVKRQADALQKMRAGKPWQKIKDRAGYHGLIRSLELTYGENGWHPHTHEIWMVSKDCDADWLKEKILSRWESACIRAGLLDEKKLDDFRKHAVDVKDNASNSDYLAKMDDSKHWGADREIAKASTKTGRKKGIHPFQFLVQYAEGDDKAGYRWIEYSDVMKGKRQLFWSRGLKAWADIEDLTDEELAAKQDDKADLLALLSGDQWFIVLKHKARSKILNLAENGGKAAMDEWFNCHGRTWRVDTATGEIIDC